MRRLNEGYKVNFKWYGPDFAKSVVEEINDELFIQIYEPTDEYNGCCVGIVGANSNDRPGGQDQVVEFVFNEGVAEKEVGEFLDRIIPRLKKFDESYKGVESVIKGDRFIKRNTVRITYQEMIKFG